MEKESPGQYAYRRRGRLVNGLLAALDFVRFAFRCADAMLGNVPGDERQGQGDRGPHESLRVRVLFSIVLAIGIPLLVFLEIVGLQAG